MQSPAWNDLPLEDQASVVMDITRLYGSDPFTSAQICSVIDDITGTLSIQSLALHILSQPLRELFTTPHPLINPDTTRALRRPAGGLDAQSDFHDTTSQVFKTPQAWGCHNVLAFCVNQLSPDDIEKRIGVILPPTLTMMDDWDPAWRGRGCTVLSNWVEKFPAVTMQRMGLDKLLLDSLIHTLSLRSNPPLPHVLGITVKLLDRTTEGDKRSARLSEMMDRGILQGWIYAPSGIEGRPVLINVAEELEIMCGALGTGILRWMKVNSSPFHLGRAADVRPSFLPCSVPCSTRPPRP